jgi:5'-nucleotidase (lipoprotein e(P4) family)
MGLYTLGPALRVLAMSSLLYGCAATMQESPTDMPADEFLHDGLDATAWVQTSSEYRSIAYATFRSAERRLDELYSCDSSSTATPRQAVVMDIDETVFDNSPYQAWLIVQSKQRGRTVGYEFSSWQRWMELAEAPGVPGAVEFISYARTCGLSVYFITNRQCSTPVCPEQEWTINNLNKLGVMTEDQQLLLKNEKPQWSSSEKDARRQSLIDAGFELVMLIGDDSNDFVNGVYKADIKERAKIIDLNRDLWGKKYFVLPGPTYGSWKKSETLPAPVTEMLILPSRSLDLGAHKD